MPCQPGTFPTSYFAPDFEGPITKTYSPQHISLSADGTYIETCYPPGSSDSGGGAGATMQITAGPALTYTLSYQVLFPEGFIWQTAGKMPGLCGGNCDDSGTSTAFSARLMWRAGGLGEVLLDNNDQLRGDWAWVADGQWHTVTESIDVPAGTLTITYNGTTATLTGLTLPVDPSALQFSTFFGGGCVAPSPLQTVSWRDFTVG
jgi:hypothetical protein